MQSVSYRFKVIVVHNPRARRSVAFFSSHDSSRQDGMLSPSTGPCWHMAVECAVELMSAASTGQLYCLELLSEGERVYWWVMKAVY